MWVRGGTLESGGFVSRRVFDSSKSHPFESVLANDLSSLISEGGKGRP